MHDHDERTASARLRTPLRLGLTFLAAGALLGGVACEDEGEDLAGPTDLETPETDVSGREDLDPDDDEVIEAGDLEDAEEDGEVDEDTLDEDEDVDQFEDDLLTEDEEPLDEELEGEEGDRTPESLAEDDDEDAAVEEDELGAAIEEEAEEEDDLNVGFVPVETRLEVRRLLAETILEASRGEIDEATAAFADHIAPRARLFLHLLYAGAGEDIADAPETGALELEPLDWITAGERSAVVKVTLVAAGVREAGVEPFEAPSRDETPTATPTPDGDEPDEDAADGEALDEEEDVLPENTYLVDLIKRQNRWEIVSLVRFGTAAAGGDGGTEAGDDGGTATPTATPTSTPEAGD